MNALGVMRQALKDAWSDLWTVLVCNLVWLLAQLLIIPGPPATLALFYYANQKAKGEPSDLSDFWYGFRHYWRPAWRWGLLNDALLIVLAGDYLLTGRLSQGMTAHLIQGFYLALLGVWLLIQLLTLPFLLEQETPSIRQALRNGAVMLGKNIGFSLLLGVLLTLILLAGIPLFMLSFAFGGMLLASAGNHAVLSRLAVYRVAEDSIIK
ncbi:MAG: DUF624 domain-containing protein [Omnitrophica WOR_2 bacterium]